ncbi:MAG: hypothetical protein PHW95_05730, partial [Patescibacteria group bacterium]|nr:hypothetical protein [Patescibacteria group bacterium]
TCWESPENIAKKLGIDPKTVRKYQKALVNRNWIKQVGTSGKTKPTIEYQIIDLWPFNMNYYDQKEKGIVPESVKNENSSPKIRETVPKEKGTVTNKEELLKKNQKEEEKALTFEELKNSNKFSDLELEIIKAFMKFGFSVTSQKLNDLEDWLEELETDFLDEVNILQEVKKWRDYFELKPPKNTKKSFRNWLIKSKEYAKNNSQR